MDVLLSFSPSSYSAIRPMYFCLPRETITINITYNNSIRVDEWRLGLLRVLSGAPDLRGQSRVFNAEVTSLLLPSLWTSRGRMCRPFSALFYRPDGSAFPTARRLPSSFANWPSETRKRPQAGGKISFMSHLLTIVARYLSCFVLILVVPSNFNYCWADHLAKLWLFNKYAACYNPDPLQWCGKAPVVLLWTRSNWL